MREQRKSYIKITLKGLIYEHRLRLPPQPRFSASCASDPPQGLEAYALTNPEEAPPQVRFLTASPRGAPRGVRLNRL